MPEPTDEQREQDARDRARMYAGEQLGMAGKDREFLLRLLDAERARADAAEAKVARMQHLGRAWLTNGTRHTDLNVARLTSVGRILLDRLERTDSPITLADQKLDAQT